MCRIELAVVALELSCNARRHDLDRARRFLIPVSDPECTQQLQHRRRQGVIRRGAMRLVEQHVAQSAHLGAHEQEVGAVMLFAHDANVEERVAVAAGVGRERVATVPPLGVGPQEAQQGGGDGRAFVEKVVDGVLEAVEGESVAPRDAQHSAGGVGELGPLREEIVVQPRVVREQFVFLDEEFLALLRIVSAGGSNAVKELGWSPARRNERRTFDDPVEKIVLHVDHRVAGFIIAVDVVTAVI